MSDATPAPGFLISKELAERIANYLAQRPWAEVNGMLGELMQLRPAQRSQPIVAPTESELG